MAHSKQPLKHVTAEDVNVNNEEESDEEAPNEEEEEEPSIEVVEDAAGLRGGETEEPEKKKRRRRLKVYVVFHGDRASRRLPHAVRVKCPRDGSWDRGEKGVASLKKAFAERYAQVHPRAPRLDAMYFVNKAGIPVVEGDELRLYVESEGVLHLILGVAPADAKPPTPNLVLQWGYDPLATSDRLSPRAHPQLARKRCVGLACGWLHAVAVLDSGRAFAWGSNDFGQLGTGDEKKSREPVQCAVDSDVRLGSVACGSYFTCCVDIDNGDLYTWGRYQASNSPTKFVDTWTNGYAKRGETGVRGERVIKVAAGEAHTVVATASNQLFSWGYNEQWQLGWGQHEPEHQGQQKPKTLAPFLPKAFAFPVASLSCGGQHTCVVDANGKLYAWGSNYEGQIGRVIRQAFGDPQDVSSMERETCVGVACGRYSTLAVTSTGDAFFWGSLSGSAAQQTGSSAQNQQSGEEKKDAAAEQEAPAFGALSGAARMLAGAQKQHVASDVADGSVGEAHGLLRRKSANTLDGWGYNAYGQALAKLDPKTDVIETPTRVDLATDLFDPAAQSVLAIGVAGGTTTLLVSPPSSSSFSSASSAE